MQRKTSISLIAGLSAIVAIIVLLYGQQRAPSGETPVFSIGRLTIETGDGKTAAFNVELAETPEQQRQGLMFRRSLPQDSGMLFLFKSAAPVDFWMKNTLIPLDMIFVREDGAIAKIAARTVPHDLTKISSGEPVSGVLEINGGEAERLGLKPGDKVLYPALGENGQK
ncbi:MAG: DUF192 domain-containing protein [Alphaproteobacteria bacterium]|nr:DUF192 domain-containing protein [Alphaproteobacteria bacterium]